MVEASRPQRSRRHRSTGHRPTRLWTAPVRSSRTGTADASQSLAVGAVVVLFGYSNVADSRDKDSALDEVYTRQSWTPKVSGSSGRLSSLRTTQRRPGISDEDVNTTGPSECGNYLTPTRCRTRQ
ncbi:hypothetical protein C9J85_05270 [Haloferax sp. wsp5]|nr:hypothetical protein C9J85_05270 [Haloferax sp. wsp5]